MDRIDVIARLPITFTAVDGSLVHSPMVMARVGSVETLLVLDTGSEVHLLTRELADRIGLVGEPGEQGVDHAGATMPSWDVGSVRLELAGVELELEDVVAIPAPPPFPGWGVGGIVSPQHLHPAAWAVIDLRADELLLIEADAADLHAWLAARAPDLDPLVLPRDPGFPSVVVRAAIDPHPEIPVMLNTGGKHTEFDASAVPGTAHGAIERSGGGVSGADVRAAIGGPARLVVAGRTIPVARLHVRESMLEPHGLVGADVLRGTVLACAADPRRDVIWLVAPVAGRERASRHPMGRS